jgi:pantoate--beta-alanine ligase
MTLELLHGVDEFRAACDAVRRQGSLGLVPTMGALHRGHLALVEKARESSSAVAVTIFVNPTQFGPGEDFSRYPRTLERDVELLREAGARLVFAPAAEDMYPRGEKTRVRVSGLTEHLCGPKRPGHFEGVATIVSKLFAVAGPCTAVFGRKDYQQLKVIERMVRDLLLPIRIVGFPTVRDADGLALSSRNAYLSAEERQRALAIPRALSAAALSFAAGERRSGEILAAAEQAIGAAATRIDYISLVDAEELAPLDPGTPLPDRTLLAVAAFVGPTRLIDNLVLGEERAPLSTHP